MAAERVSGRGRYLDMGAAPPVVYVNAYEPFHNTVMGDKWGRLKPPAWGQIKIRPS